MKIALDFNVSADAKENATTVQVLNALTGVLNGGANEAPAKPFAKAVAETEKAKPAPEMLKEEVQKVAPATAKTEAPVKAKPATAKTEAPVKAKKLTVEEMQNEILVIAQRYGKKGKTAEVKKLRSAVSGALRISEVTDEETLQRTLDAFKMFDAGKGENLDEVLAKYQPAEEADEEEEY